jgi:hypothetical protein
VARTLRWQSRSNRSTIWPQSGDHRSSTPQRTTGGLLTGLFRRRTAYPVGHAAPIAGRHVATEPHLPLLATDGSAVPPSIGAVAWAIGVIRFAVWCRPGSTAAALRAVGSVDGQFRGWPPPRSCGSACRSPVRLWCTRATPSIALRRTQGISPAVVIGRQHENLRLVVAHKRAPFAVPAGRDVPSHIDALTLRFG